MSEGKIIADFAELVQRKRVAKGLSQTDLAKLLKIGRTQLVNIEMANSRPGFVVALKLMNALKISPKDLL